MKPISIAVVTKQRPRQLEHCLQSVVVQTIKPSQIIIVDNDPEKSALPVVKQLINKLSVIYRNEKISNVPHARNTALKNCQTPFLGFVDDDCLLGQDWVEKGLSALDKDQRSAYVEGQSLLLNKDSIIAQSLFYRQNYWFRYKLVKHTNLTTPYNLDTKNVIFRTNILKRHHFRFDGGLYLNTVGDHADMDLGFQLEKFGYYGIYERKMIVYHEEIEGLHKFIQKAYERGRVGFLLYHKWNLKGEMVYLPDIKITKYIRRLKCWPMDYQLWTKDVRGGFIKRFGLLILMKLYDRVFLQGFADEAKRRSITLDFSDTNDS